MVNLELRAVDKSTYIVRASFADEDGAAATPTAVTWTLTDSAGNVINEREGEVIAPDDVIDIVLSGEDLDFADGPTRVLIVEATYTSTLGAGLPLKNQCKFDIENLLTV